jgi:hypothetical protein
MKTETFTCDTCEFKTNDETKIFEARITVYGGGVFSRDFHVCKTCWDKTPKGVFQKAFNALLKFLGN